MAKKSRPLAPATTPPKGAPLRPVAVVACAFLLSVVVIVSLELAAGWNLDTSEKSFIVLVCLMGSFAARWLLIRFGRARG